MLADDSNIPRPNIFSAAENVPGRMIWVLSTANPQGADNALQ